MENTTYYHLCKELQERLNIRMYSNEYEIILFLYEIGEHCANDIRYETSMSGATFFNTLKRLVDLEIISSDPDINDRRSKVYKLNDWARQCVDGIYRPIIAKTSKPKVLQSFGIQNRVNMIGGIEESLNVPYLHSEYMILGYLYSASSANSDEVERQCRGSPSSIFSSLKRLVQNGRVIKQRDTTDRRRVTYYLAPETQQMMRRHFERIVPLLASRLNVENS